MLGFILSNDHPIRSFGKKASSKTLQASIILFGAGLNFNVIIDSGLTGALTTLISILIILLIGAGLSKLFKIDPAISNLINIGTAICGGSAIAAVTPVLKSNKTEIATSIGIVFLLNAAAVFVFPPVGHLLNLSDLQFGTWAALAIHDTSSVVAASQVYSEQALEIAAQLKLTRALWILPLVFALARYRSEMNTSSRAVGAGDINVAAKINAAGGVSTNNTINDIATTKPPIPWFIFLFLMASLAFTFIPSLHPFTGITKDAGKIGFSVALFLIGIQMNRSQIKSIPIGTLLYGVALWITALSLALFYVVKCL